MHSVSNLSTSLHDGGYFLVMNLALLINIFLVLKRLCMGSIVVVNDLPSLLSILLLRFNLVLSLLSLPLVVFFGLLQSIILLLLSQLLLLVVLLLSYFDLLGCRHSIHASLRLLDSLVYLTVDTSLFSFVCHLFHMVLLALFVLVLDCLNVLVDYLLALSIA